MTDFNRTSTDGEPLLDGSTPPTAEAEKSGLASVRCSACDADVVPRIKNHCPVCGGWVAPNDASTIHAGRARLTAADLRTRDALLDRLLRERGGREALDIVAQLRCEDFATAQVQLGKVTARLETLGAVSAAGSERKSLVAMYVTFSARAERLAAELPPVIARTPAAGTPRDLYHLSGDELVTRIEALLDSARRIRDLEVMAAERSKLTCP